jgi:PPK2 family polyphosphate:nucleotide phosphotransferase
MGHYQEFRVKQDAKLRLQRIDPAYDGKLDKEEAEAALARNIAKLQALQEVLYAERKRALLVCLQAIDGGGKDGVIRHVFGELNPQGVRVACFKQPTPPERDHDFLWRAHRETPGKGEIAIFNRSHYEDVLIARVRELVPKKVWHGRYEQINDFERLLADNGTHILKFFLHISKDEQLARFKGRLDDPSKHWKISAADYAEREKWADYRAAFEDAISKCSTPWAPWFVIPSNHKWFRNLAVSSIVVKYLEGLGMKYPETTVDVAEIRRKYFGKKKKS